MSISRYVEAPRMEVVFIPVDEVKDINSDTARFDICFILHSVDNIPPETMFVPDGPFLREDAVKWLGRFWMSLGGGFPTVKPR